LNSLVVLNKADLAPPEEIESLAAPYRRIGYDFLPTSARAGTGLEELRTRLKDRISAGALDAHHRALALNPFHIQNRCWYALFLQRAYGRLEEGVAEARRTLEVDPLSAYVTMVLGTALVTAGHAAEGAELGRRAVDIDPQSFHARWALGVALTHSGDLESAGRVLEQAAAMSARHHFAVTSLAINHARRNRRDLARELHQELTSRAQSTYVPATQLILTADAMGDRDEAIRHAERALADREPPLVMLARHFPDFADLRQDPRFLAILRRLDTPWPSTAS
jgi:tetratricopeptide (TPR) repeat protein